MHAEFNDFMTKKVRFYIWTCVCVSVSAHSTNYLRMEYIKVVCVLQSDYPNNAMIMYQKQWTVCRNADNLLCAFRFIFGSCSYYFLICIWFVFYFVQLKMLMDTFCRWTSSLKSGGNFAWYCMKNAIYQTWKTSSNIFIKYYHKNESCVRCYQIDSHPLGARWRTLIFSRICFFFFFVVCVRVTFGGGATAAVIVGIFVSLHGIVWRGCLKFPFSKLSI